MTKEEKSIYNKAYSIANKERIAHNNNIWRLKNAERIKQYESRNPEIIKKKRDKYNERYPERNKARYKRYRENNKDLINAKAREQNKLYPEKFRQYHVKTKYGLSWEEYTKMLKEQGYKCSICVEHKEGEKFYVDHCHKTGKVRGLICRNHNTGLGNFKDNIESLKLAIKYLEKYADTN